jgi:hypothetical protein
MRSTISSLVVSFLLATALATVPSLSAADSNSKAESGAAQKNKPGAEPKKAKRDWYPFGGTVASVNKPANTISLKKKEGERVLKLDAKSTLEIDGKPTTIDSVKVGSYAHGKLHKASAGKEVVTSAKFDREPPKKTKGTTGKTIPEPQAPDADE